MNSSWKIWLCLTCLSLSVNVFCQSRSAQITQIKKYKASIDSLHAFYDTLSRSLDENSMRLFYTSGLGEGIAEGVYEAKEAGVSKNEGGFSVYIFAKKDTTYRIYYEGGKRDAYVTKTFYYKNDTLVYSEMTVRLWAGETKKPYTEQEIYWGNKIIEKNILNVLPDIKDRSLIPGSLFQDGTAYYNLFRSKAYRN